MGDTPIDENDRENAITVAVRVLDRGQWNHELAARYLAIAVLRYERELQSRGGR